MLVGHGDRTRTQAEVCILFNDKYPKRLTTRSVVSKVEKKFRDFYKTNRLTVPENT